MDHLDDDFPRLLLDRHEPPCLSLYQPTHPAHPDKQQDPIRYRNLLRSLEASLAQRFGKRDMAALLAPMHALADDHDFWNRVHNGLAVLRSAEMFGVYRLQRSVPEIALVADSFHTKPLLRIQQSADRYQILALHRDRVTLYEGNRDALAKIDPAREVPATMPDEYIARERERESRVYGASTPAGTTHHGTGVAGDIHAHEIERYFRAVDKALTEHHSRSSRLPLLLAALPEHHGLFRSISRNPFLLGAALEVNPGDLALDELRRRAWQAIEPEYLARLAGLTDAFQAAAARQQGSSDLADVSHAAFEGRVYSLLIDADRQVPGRIGAGGAIELAAVDAPDVDDLIDDVGVQVLRTGGDVVVVPSERMPSASGVAATWRY